MVNERTEEEKLTCAPIVVMLGGKEHEIAQLVIRDSRKWRAKVGEALASLPSYSNVTTEDIKLFGEAINAMLVGVPDTVINLFFDYAKDLNREDIESIATDAELAKAFEQVVDIAFPLADGLVRTMVKLSQ